MLQFFFPRFAYTANVLDNTISSYVVTSSGMWHNGYFLTGSEPIALATNDRYLYCANYGGGTISGFSIDLMSGRLTEIVGSPFSAGSLLSPSQFSAGTCWSRTWVRTTSAYSKSIATPEF